jgi:hypothetical protein
MPTNRRQLIAAIRTSLLGHVVLGIYDNWRELPVFRPDGWSFLQNKCSAPRSSGENIFHTLAFHVI